MQQTIPSVDASELRSTASAGGGRAAQSSRVAVPEAHYSCAELDGLRGGKLCPQIGKSMLEGIPWQQLLCDTLEGNLPAGKLK